jgi:hypothetical protein
MSDVKYVGTACYLFRSRDVYRGGQQYSTSTMVTYRMFGNLAFCSPISTGE